jgi:hypothetical protein
MVDLDRTRVSAVYYLSRLDSAPVAASGEGLDSARQAARRYAMRICPELGARVVFASEVPVPNRRAATGYLFLWRERSGEAYTGKTLTIRVAASTGRVQSASLWLPRRGPLPRPRVGAEAAVSLARKAARALTGDAVEVLSASLVLSHPAAPQEGPVWLVEVRPPGGTWTDMVCIDACNASVIYPAPRRPERPARRQGGS